MKIVKINEDMIKFDNGDHIRISENNNYYEDISFLPSQTNNSIYNIEFNEPLEFDFNNRKSIFEPEGFKLGNNNDGMFIMPVYSNQQKSHTIEFIYYNHQDNLSSVLGTYFMEKYDLSALNILN